MDARLTIALPTYNRAPLLEQQLAWLARSVKGYESRCRILVSDNCSTDATPDLIAQWRASLDPSVDVRVVRHPENIGPVRNIASCIAAASTSHVWTISDDDEIADDAVEQILERLDAHPDLSLVLLNFSSRMYTGEPMFHRCFEVEEEWVTRPGRELFERFLRYRHDRRWGGLALTTAVVYHSDAARRALSWWPKGTDNLLAQLLWTGYCALDGAALVTREPLLESVAGRAHFVGHEQHYFAFRAAHTSEAFVKLAETGYSPGLVLRKLLERPGAFVKMVPRNLVRDPRFALSVLGRYLGALAKAATLALRLRRSPSRADQHGR